VKAPLKHLSVGVKDPKQAADALAELTGGNVRPFRPVKGAYVCLWPDWSGQFIEFYPSGTVLVPTDDGADFRKTTNRSEFRSIHINLDTELTGNEVKTIAGRYGFRHVFRPSDGGPLHEVWIENALLIELVTKDLQ